MTYRIDNITWTKDRSGSRWQCDFKGLRGAGEYANFYSGTDGKGLFWHAGGKGLELFDESVEFDCPLDRTDGQAYLHFCALLDRLGWGPEETPWAVCKRHRFTEAELQGGRQAFPGLLSQFKR